MPSKTQSAILMLMQNQIFKRLEDHPLLRYVYQMVREEEIRTILEIGSTDDSSSTEILVAAVEARPADLPPVHVYALEADPEKHRQLQLRYRDKAWLEFFALYSRYPMAYPSEAQVLDFYRTYDTALRRYSQEQILSSLRAEKTAYMRQAPPQDGIEMLRQRAGLGAAESFDLVILDGSEFTGQADLEAVYGARILILDDINTYKNHANYQRLKADPDYYLIQENWRHMHGAAVFKRRAPLLPGIEAVIHTRNAAAKLPDCLASLRWVDECLVVDMYSEDETVAVARKYGARVVQHVPVTCVDEARNFGLAQVRHSWTLVLDADERLPESLAQALRDCAVENAEPNAFWLPRKNFFFGTWAPSLFPDYQLRFFRSQKVSWRGIVHEPAKVLEGLSAWFKADPEHAIVHYSYDSVSEFFARQVNYAHILWKQYQQYLPAKQLLKTYELRKNHDRQLEQLYQYLQKHSLDHHAWLIKHLYLFSELANTAYFLEQSGQLQGQEGRAQPKLSVYAYIKNGEKFDYPFIESLLSVLDVCDEAIVTCAEESEDQTWLRLQRLAELYPQIRLLQTQVWQQTGLQDGEVIRLAAEEAMSHCSGDWLWHVQSDEVYTQEDARKVRELVNTYHSQAVDGFIFQVRHFYGSYEQVISEQAAEIGWYQKCIRLARVGTAQHFGDAWTLMMSDQKPTMAIPVEVWIFHYGHVREKEAMRIKASYMQRLYHDLPIDFEVCPPGEFRYDQVAQQYLEPYLEAHPETMLLRIAQKTVQARLTDRARKPRLLVVSRYPKVKKGYGITFSELYQLGILQQHFEVHHLAWHYHGEDSVENGVHFYPDHEHYPQHPEHLRELLLRLNPDLILLHADPHFFLAYLAELKAWRGPVMAWFTIDYERSHNPDSLLPLFERCQRIASMADFSLAQVRRDYQGPVAKIPLGVNTQFFHPPDHAEKQLLRQALQIPEEAFVFLTVANNFWRKGLEYAVYAIAIFKQRYPQAAAEVLFYFHSEETTPLKELVATYGLEQQIRFSQDFDPYRNPLPVSELIKLYQASDAFLLSSLGEGFGMPLLEAQACGLPLVVSDNTVIREVTGGHASYVRCPGLLAGQNAGRVVWMRAPDPEHLAEQIFRLVANPDLRQEQAEKGLHNAHKFSWQQTGLLLAAELAKCLETGTLEYLPPEPGVHKI